MSVFYGRRFLSVLMGALTVLGSSVASAGKKRLGRDTKVSSARRARKKIGEGNGKGRKRRRLKADCEVEDVGGLRSVLSATSGEVVSVSSDGEGGSLVFVKTPAGIVTVSVVGASLLTLFSYLAYSAFSGGKKTDGGDQNPGEDPGENPGENPKEEVVLDRPACFDGLSTGEKDRFIEAFSSFGFESDSSPKDFVTSGEKMPGDGEFDSRWGRFFVKEGGRISRLAENGDRSDAVVFSSEGLNCSMSGLSERVFSLFGDDVKSISGIFAHFLTVCWVYAKHADKVFYIGKSNGEYGYYVNEDMFKDETFKSEVISTYNEIKKWVVSCRNEED